MKKNEKTIHGVIERESGFSLPSVIVGSIIAAVLGTVAISSMWGSVDKAKVAAEKSTISEMKTAVFGLMEDNGGFPIDLSANLADKARSKLSNLPSSLGYQIVLVQNGTTETSDDYFVIKAIASSNEQITHLRNVVEQLYLDLNGDETLPASTETGSKFAYDSTCTSSDSSEDCFYISYVGAKKNAPAQLDITTNVGDTGGTALNGSSGSVIPLANLIGLNF